MGLKLYYKYNDQYVEVSSGGLFTDPVPTVHDGKTGDIITTQLFLRNDDANLWYSNITVRGYDLTETVDKNDVNYTSTGWGVKLSAEELEPTLAGWNGTDWGNTISIQNIGSTSGSDVSTYVPFWRLLTCPPYTEAQVKRNISLRVEYTENAV